MQKSELNSYPGWKTISHSGFETLGWEMEPKAFPNTHDLIWFDLICSYLASEETIEKLSEFVQYRKKRRYL